MSSPYRNPSRLESDLAAEFSPQMEVSEQPCYQITQIQGYSKQEMGTKGSSTHSK